MTFGLLKSKVATKIRPARSAAMPSGNPGPGLGSVAKRTTPSASASAGVANPMASSASSNASKRLTMTSSPEGCDVRPTLELPHLYVNASCAPREPARRSVQPLEARPGYADELADLDPGLVVGRHDIRLNDDRHVLLQRHRGE